MSIISHTKQILYVGVGHYFYLKAMLKNSFYSKKLVGQIKEMMKPILLNI